MSYEASLFKFWPPDLIGPTIQGPSFEPQRYIDNFFQTFSSSEPLDSGALNLVRSLGQ